jgi:excinuclease ABC subunit B
MGKGYDREAQLISRSRLATTPMAHQMDIEATSGSYAGERPFGRAANLPSARPRKPTDADMGPHNWGGGEARPKGGKMRGRRRGESSRWR